MLANARNGGNLMERARYCNGFTTVAQTPSPDNDWSLGVIIYFKPYVEKYLEIDPIRGMSIITEETSHFCYIHNYFNAYGKIPDSAAMEMIGAIDQCLLTADFGNINNKQDLDYLMDLAFNEAEEVEESEVEHIIGHSFAKGLLRKLTIMATEEGINSRNEIYRKFYSLENKMQMAVLLDYLNPSIFVGDRIKEVAAYF